MPLRDDIILAVTHFQSKYNFDNESQALECASLSDYIKLYEEEIGHKRTILVGDLNMNPFESGVVGAKGLHAVMAKSIARSGDKKILEDLILIFTILCGDFLEIIPEAHLEHIIIAVLSM